MMDRSNIRYEVLTSEEDHVPAEPVNLVMVVPPPAYPGTEDSTMNSSAMKHQALPSYEEATTLPSYEEAERSKQAEANRTDVEGQEELGSVDQRVFRATTLGTDGMFLCAFVMSFFFNWIGFLFSVCLFNTIAGRCGALSGLGLSIVKWIIIVKHNKWGNGWADEDSWVWWLLMLCGLLIFLRGAIHYAKTKYEWNKLEHSLRSRNYFLF